MDTKQRVAIYARVSSQEQAAEGVSIEAQVAALRAYARSQGWEVVDEYIDGGYSGGTDERPALKRILIDAGQRRFSIIAVCKLDRFFRNLRLLLNHLHGLEQLGIKFVSTQEGLDTSTPYGKFAVQIMGVIAEFERERIGERVRDGQQYRIAHGKWASGRTLYGYRWLPKEQRWEIVPEEAEIVRYIYHLYVNEKLGSTKIPLRLNQEGYCTRSGASWGFGAVNRVLTHAGYRGYHPLGLTMPIIIDETTWERARQQREKARSVRKSVKGWLLQGMCICGLCGHTLSCIQKRLTETRRYVCRGRFRDRHLDGSQKCTARWVKADWLEWSVWNKMKAILNDPHTLLKCVGNALAELEERRMQIGDETLATDRELESVKAKLERLGIAFADGAITEQLYRSKLQQLKKQEAMLLKCRQNIDPSTLLELSDLDERIATIRETMKKVS